MPVSWGVFRIPFRLLLVSLATTLLVVWVQRGGEGLRGGRGWKQSVPGPCVCLRNKTGFQRPTTDPSGRTTREIPHCSFYTSQLGQQTVPVRLDAVTYLAVKKALAVSRLQHGGHYCPADCRPRDRTAILIPYRDRRQQLMKLLFNLVPFLIRQRVCFTIFVIEQTSEFPFNRCLLFNVGFVESQKVANFTCFIVHDTDLVPRRYGNLYHCHDNRPRHFVIKRSNKPFRGLPYKTYIGGALAVRRNHMEKINGCSNLYYNWGFEDDDLYERFRMTNQTPVRYQDVTLGEYVALEHALQPRNRHKRELLSTARERMSRDGLSTLSYTLEDFLERELFTWMLVAIPPPPASLYAPSRKTPNTRH